MKLTTSRPVALVTEHEATTVSADKPPALSTLQLARLLGVARPSIFTAIRKKRLTFYTIQSDRKHVAKEYRITLGEALTFTGKEHHSLMAVLGNYLVARSMYERMLIDESTFQDLRRKLIVALVRVREIPVLQPLLEAIRADYSSHLDDIFREVMGE